MTGQDLIIAIIPARGGSKRLANKNIYPLKGKPLIAYTIDACRKSRHISDVYVSSDSEEILSVAGHHGAKPLRRAAALADDKTPKIEAIRGAVKQLEEKGIRPAVVIVPQANSPQLTAEIIDKGFDLMYTHKLWEVMSADTNGVQNAAFRIIRTEHLWNTFLSAHCGFVTADMLDVHTIDDIHKLEALLP